MHISYNKSYNIISIMFLYLLISSCATIVGKHFQTIPINSSPDKAKITITDEAGMVTFSGTTPTAVNLAKHNGSYFGSKNYRIKIEKTGYQSQVITLSPHITGWYLIGNFFLGGLIGWLIVDPFNGCMYTLSPELINCNLGNSRDNTASNMPALNICLLEDVPKHLRDKLQPISEISQR